MALRELVVKISADIKDFDKKASVVESAVKDIGEESARVGRALTVGLTAPLGLLAGFAVKAASDMDSLRRGMVAVTGSAGAAASQMAKLKDVARLPGLGFEDAVRGSINLQAAGLSAELAEGALRGFGNALASVGRGREDLDGVITALTQIAAKGKISAEEINQLAERVPQIREVMRAAFGSADTEVLQARGLEATEFIQGIITELQKLPQVAGGVRESFDNLADSTKRAAAAIGEQLLPVLLPLVDRFAEMAESADDANGSTIRWGVAIAGLAFVAGPAIAVISQLSIAASTLSVALGTSLAGVLATGGPLILGLTAVGVLVAKTTLDMASGKTAVDSLADSFRDLGGAIERVASITSGSFLADEINRALFGGPRGQVTVGDVTSEPIRRASEDQTLIDLDRAAGYRAEAEARRAAMGSAPAILRPAPPIDDKAAKDLERALTRMTETLRGAPGGLINDAGRSPFTQEGREQFQRRNDARDEFLGLGGTLDKVTVPSGGGGASSGGGIRGALSKFGGDIASQVGGLAAQFGPLAIAAAALKPVFDGLRETLGPVLATLAEPLREIGSILGSILKPALEVLAEPLKLLGDVVKLLLEPLRASMQVVLLSVGPGLKILGGILRVVSVAFSYVIQGLGVFVEALGKFVDKIVPDWISKAGKSLAKTGQEMQDNAKKIRDPASAAAEGVTDLGDAARDAAESLSNVPRVLNLALLRFRASGFTGGASGGASGGGGSTGGGVGGEARPGARPALPIAVNVSVDRKGMVETFVTEAGRVVARTEARSGTARLATAV